MGRILVPFVVLALIVLAVYGLMTWINHAHRNAEQRQRERKQRDLANFAPAVLNGAPLVDVVIDQGKQLGDVAGLLRQMQADINVFLPEEHGRRVREWLDQYEEGKRQ